MTDDFFDRVLQFDSTGRLLRTWGQRGNGDNQFDGPIRIALSADGEFMYALDVGNHRVKKFAH